MHDMLSDFKRIQNIQQDDVIFGGIVRLISSIEGNGFSLFSEYGIQFTQFQVPKILQFSQCAFLAFIDVGKNKGVQVNEMELAKEISHVFGSITANLYRQLDNT